MTTSLIHFNDNHISDAQAVMTDDCVLEAFIHNLAKPPITKIHGYLQEAKFLYTSRMLRVANSILDSSTHWWKDGGLGHTFHLPCGECTITLEDIALQVGLLVDGSTVTEAAVVLGKEDLYATLLGKFPN
ncbi:hypothetical protein PVK06_038675 [Gossypium arboreum]|uniref:Aminotransferase-like plant mobile domain-containing protein n=1 Tax=Gossypium arboreum TaxID=29729 RepID=A0ABR0N2P8_GOSAR|nr:hypothetical protein PVK06_038675 [Gossypium arboreum]